jgi:hypothetical protein
MEKIFTRGDICKDEWNGLSGHFITHYIIKFGSHVDSEGFRGIGFYGDYTLKRDANRDDSGFNLNKNDRCEVVGNIFDTKNL